MNFKKDNLCPKGQKYQNLEKEDICCTVNYS